LTREIRAIWHDHNKNVPISFATSVGPHVVTQEPLDRFSLTTIFGGEGVVKMYQHIAVLLNIYCIEKCFEQK
jgi:hypothetical protein